MFTDLHRLKEIVFAGLPVMFVARQIRQSIAMSRLEEFNKISEKVIGAAYAVHNKLGWGFLEKVYQNALEVELRKTGLRFAKEKPISVYYDGIAVGDYAADFIVEDAIIVELKAVRELSAAHETQLMNYLKATGIELGLLINFGVSVQIKRRIWSPTNTFNEGQK